MIQLRQRLGTTLIGTLQALRIVWSSSRFWTTASIILMLLQGVLPIVLLVLIGQIIDAVTTIVTGASTSSFEEIIPGLILVAAVAIAEGMLGSLITYVREGQNSAVAEHISAVIHQQSAKLDLAYYENAAYQDTLHRVQMEAPLRPQMIVDSLLSLGQSTFTLVGIAGLLITLNPVTPFILLLGALPIGIVRVYFARRLYQWQAKIAQTERLASYFNYMLTSAGYAKEIRLYDTSNVFSDRYIQLRKRLRRERLSISRQRTIADLLTQLVTVAALFLAFGLVIRDVLTSALTIGELVIAWQAFQRGQSSLRALLGSFATLYESQLFLREFYRFLGMKSHIAAPPNPVPIPVPMQQGIRFENVRFHYQSDGREVLKDISFEIKPGEVIALVGENGAGKTTLVKLLCRLYDPTEGRITLDGCDLREYDPKALQGMITSLFQDFNLFQLSALENVWLGNTKSPPELEAIRKAARESGADEVIEALPKGYDTELGVWFSGGKELSQGQWQKVALARTFFRQSHVIILDEPTSALDVLTESQIIDRFRMIVAGRTAVLISHRLSTVRMADRILVLDDGRIVEDGTHDALMALNGKYAEMFLRQAGYYR